MKSIIYIFYAVKIPCSWYSLQASNGPILGFLLELFQIKLEAMDSCSLSYSWLALVRLSVEFILVLTNMIKTNYTFFQQHMAYYSVPFIFFHSFIHLFIYLFI